MQMPFEKNMSIAEREKLLWKMSRQYMRGEITLQQLDERRSKLLPALSFPTSDNSAPSPHTSTTDYKALQ